MHADHRTAEYQRIYIFYETDKVILERTNSTRIFSFFLV